MNIHEYQAKEILGRHGVPLPRGRVAESAEAAEAAARDIGGVGWAVKAQVHAGGRGKAGGIRLAGSPEEVRTAAESLLGSQLVTAQTGPEGKTVRRVYVEQNVGYARELYLAVLVDRSLGRVALIGAREGGEDIEDKAAADPASIQRLAIDPGAGFDPAAAADFAHSLGLDGAQGEAAVATMAALYEAFVDCDASLIEVNPLVVTSGGELLALDVKMVLDDNALFRHPDLETLRDQDEVDPTELEARRFELNYVKLRGDIGVMVNGAGLALATIDLLQHHGGEPADFMDIRPEATRAQVADGFRMLLANPEVKAILVNVYGGGILRCDTIAEGVAAACRSEGLNVPLVVRLAGTNRELAHQILSSQGIRAVFAKDLGEATSRAVEAAKREAA